MREPAPPGPAAPEDVRVVAIDGPSASGKSTVARAVARALGALYVDSGAVYRGVTWQALRTGADPRRPESVLAALERSRWRFFVEEGAVVFRVDGERPGRALRSEAVREAVSDVAAVPGVRAFVAARLREARRFGPLVMEGRDIGTVVFPATPHAFYLDADPSERARRRLRDIVSLEGRGDASSVRDSLARRDLKDRTRPAAPLQVAPRAVVIDSTALGVDAVVERIVRAVRGEGAAP